jgi:type II secretory pathway pseudopilin PulG
VLILGTLSAVAVPGFIAQKNRADIAAANAQGRALMASCKNVVSDPTGTTKVDINLWDVEDFGAVRWTPDPSIKTSSGAVASCSSTTTGGNPTLSKQQQYYLNTTTGEVTDKATTGPAQDAEA